MVGRIAPLSSPPVFPFQSFPPANLLRACPSGSRASAPSFLQRPIVVLPSAPLNSRPLILLQTLCRCEKSQPLWNQANPNSFAKTRGGIPPEAAQTFSVHLVPPWQIHSFQAFAASLPSISTSRPLFSSTWSLFSQNTRVGVPPFPFQLPSRLRILPVTAGVCGPTTANWNSLCALDDRGFAEDDSRPKDGTSTTPL